MMEAGDAAATTPRAAARPPRIAVLVLAGIEVLLLGGLVFLGLTEALSSSESLSRSLGGAIAIMAAIPLLLCSIPALVLGVMRRWLWVALGLAVVAVPVGLLVRYFM